MKTNFNSKSELFEYLRANKELLITEKKASMKHADACISFLLTVNENKEVVKAVSNPDLLSADSFKVAAAINTTNILDSHMDVHIPGLWDKSLQENPRPYLLEQHIQSFKNVISDNVTASTVMMSWADLGKDGRTWKGQTQVLLFDAEIEKLRNEYMAEQYAKGRVKNHSVGMQYVALELCMNSDSKYDKVEKEAWDKYIGQVVNRSVADAYGYFWAVTEAKVIEGSAVLMGSNPVTPTISIGESKEHQKESIDYNKIIQAIQINN